MAIYDIPVAKSTLTRESLSQRQGGIWRWSEILPVRTPSFRMTLGEANAPVLQAFNLGKALGLPALFIKDESHGPLGSLEHRGLTVAVARALELGVRDFTLAAYGSDGPALAACAARSRSRAHIFMSKDAPVAEQVAVKTFGAQLILVDGLFSDAACMAAEVASSRGWLDISAFREPYRCEGAKTIGLELAEAFAWELPDVIILPTGDGLELLGLWKTFGELEQLGLLGAKRPRLVAAQASGCAPLARAFDEKSARASRWQHVETVISALRIADVFADRLILRAIRESMGTVVAVADQKILAYQKELALCEGIFAAPQVGAGLAALQQLVRSGWINNDECVVIVNPASGLNYLSQ